LALGLHCCPPGMPRIGTTFVVLVGLLAGAVPVRAARGDGEPAIDPENPIQGPKRIAFGDDDLPSGPEAVKATAIYLVTGGPIGIGLEMVHRFGTYWEISAGGGIDPTLTSSAAVSAYVNNPLTWAVMPRLRFGTPWSFTIGSGLSGSNDVGRSSCSIADDECISVVQRAGYIVRGDLEGGAERWWLNGFGLRLFGGYGIALNPDALKCVSGHPSCPPVSASAPYVGVGIGYAF
jgi:hypothetical protein